MAESKSSQACGVPYCSNLKKETAVFVVLQLSNQLTFKKEMEFGHKREQDAGSTYLCVLHFKKDVAQTLVANI